MDVGKDYPFLGLIEVKFTSAVALLVSVLLSLE
jgi:hypothetical protein